MLAALLPGANRLTAQETEPDWQLVWWDEFDQTGAPDPNRWTPEVGYIRNNEAQYYAANRSENARVEDGHLVLEARRDQWDGHEYTSASLHTAQTASWTYGRIEVRAQIPTGRGMWPAIWMLGANIGEVGWPKCGEIDIMENVGFAPRIHHTNVHTETYNHANGTAQGAATAVDSPWEDFHLYTVEWFPHKIDFYFDDQKVFTFNNEGTGVDEWPFDAPHYLLLNVAVGGSWGGEQGIDDDIFPQQMQVDYVRVYTQKEPGPYSLQTRTQGNGQILLSPVMDAYPEGTEVTLQAHPAIGSRFDGWIGADLGTSRQSRIAMQRDLDLTAHFSTPGEMLNNGHFEEGREGWVGPFPPTGVTVEVSADTGYLGVDIGASGLDPWQVQLVQSGKSIVQGERYRLSFDGWATVEGTVQAFVSLSAAPWTSYGGIDALLTAQRRSYSVEFEMTHESNPQARVELNLGRIPGKVMIDNLSLVRVSESSASLFRLWKEAHGVEETTGTADPDQDGNPILCEYVLGLDPMWKDEPMLQPRWTGSQFQLTLPARDAKALDAAFVLESTSNFLTWTPEVGDRIQIAEQEGNRFFRGRATLLESRPRASALAKPAAHLLVQP